jgi:hypothetical protein
MKLNVTISSLLAAAASVLACSGKVVPIGELDQTSERLPDSGAPSAVGEDASASAGNLPAVPAFTIHRTADEARALCSSPHGPVDPPKNALEFGARLTRRWYNCSRDAASGSMVEAAEALEIAGDGSVTALIATDQGSFSRLQGVDSQGTWVIFCDRPPPGSPPVSVQPPGDTTHLAPCGFVPTVAGGSKPADYVQFEVSPRRARFEELGVPGWYVAIDE